MTPDEYQRWLQRQDDRRNEIEDKKGTGWQLKN